MKKLVSMALVLVLCVCFASSAFAIDGRVNVSTWLNLRKAASTTSGIRAYIKNNTQVEIIDGLGQDSGFYHIRSESYMNHDTWDVEGKATRIGYASMKYIVDVRI